MQFHLNGYRPGDPAVAVRTDARAEHRELPHEVDVLIVGCGPAGLTLAAQLSAFPSITTCIVDLKDGPLLVGQADGIACRTMEMFQAFGFAERVEKEAYWVNETAFWKPDPDSPTQIIRQSRIRDTEDGLSEFPHTILNQARVHDFLLEVMCHSEHQSSPYYSRAFSGLSLLPVAREAYPVVAEFTSVRKDEGNSTAKVRAKYLVGCDGARSHVREAIGLTLAGDSANHAWGVMDVLAVTDFPDVRLKTIIQSATQGSIILIPREGGYLFRLYIELEKLDPQERVSARNITLDDLIAAAQRILSPYRLDVKEVPWWSVYEIGQRLCNRFDNSDPDKPESPANVFIAGDACHTHSPKAGQGMNVSIQDSFNLGWKLAAVLEGRSPEALLRTYSAERQAVASELIAFDRELASKISSRNIEPSTAADTAPQTDSASFQRYFTKHARYTAGTSIRYAESLIVGSNCHQELAPGFEIGTRFHSAQVVRLADAKPVELGHCVTADGRWRLLLFAGVGDAAQPGGPIVALCHFLECSDASPVLRFTRGQADQDSVIDVRAVFQCGCRDLPVDSLPALLLPQKGRLGLRDYEKVYCSRIDKGADVYTLRQINRQYGCMVVVRPDQHVANILPLGAHRELSRFFDGFMLAHDVDNQVASPSVSQH